MDTNKILSADLLDLIFDERNKEYGAYELRKTYQRRVIKSLIFAGLFVALTCTGAVLANKLNPKENSLVISNIGMPGMNGMEFVAKIMTISIDELPKKRNLTLILKIVISQMTTS